MINKKFYGRMSAPDASARITGACGDDMEFYLVIENNKITDIKYYTEQGCDDTHLAGSAVAKKALNMNLPDALGISAKEIMNEIESEDNHRHCAILAVSTFYKAVADYLLQP